MSVFVKEIKEFNRIIREVKSRIPESCASSFYGNIDDLCAYKSNKLNHLGYYPYKDNRIELNVDRILSANNDMPNFGTFIIKHEMYHAFSTKYDSKKNIVYSGFNKIFLNSKEKKYSDIHTNLTEGYSDLLAIPISDKNFEYRNIYHTFAAQLSIIIGKDIMDDAYFNNKGIEILKEELKRLGNEPNKVDSFFDCFDELHIDISYGSGIKSADYLQHLIDGFLDKKIENTSLREEKRRILEKYRVSQLTNRNLLELSNQPNRTK